ncbi:MAG: LEPR-XLL domain-containing protein, partial [Phycisphaera sp.]|nr:LEPR-XLL domain-containing protein [Phycisphaera sp.]
MSERQSRRARVLWLCRWFLSRLRRGAARVVASTDCRETRLATWRDLETLEPRVLMSASVAGKVFDDTNQNGLYESGEQGLSDWRVYVDADGDGVRDIGETYVMSSASGDYVLPNLVAGTHQIRVEYPAGWEATDPWLEVNNVTVADGDSLTGVNFSAQFVDFGIITQSGSANLISGPSTVDEADVFTLALNTGGNTAVGWTIAWGDGTVDEIQGTPSFATHEYDDGDITRVITATLQNSYEGVSRAYWRNHLEDWVGASPTDSFNAIFGVSATGNPTLDDAINANGGHENHLLREATAALLNALHPELFASLSFDDLKSLVQQAYATGDFTSFAVQINQASTNSGIIQGGELTDTLSVFVENEPPTLILSGPSSVNQGETYTLGLFSNDTSADTITHWTVNYGDGNIVTVPGDPSETTHVYAAPGNYIISATATDEDGTFSANSIGVTVSSVGSPVTISGPGVSNEGSVYTLGIATSGTIQSLSVNWGDGVVESLAPGVTSAAHTYIDGANVFPVVAEVTTASGTFSSNTISVNVANVAPIVTISGPPEVDEGTAYVLTLGATDPGADTITQTVINWGDGTVETVTGLPSSRSHVYDDGSASYTVVATVTDEDGSTNSNNLTVTVNNVAPTVTISGAPEVDEGSSYVLTLAVTDPGLDTVTQIEVNWGDGHIETFAGSPTSVSHVFADGPNTHVISATVTDEDGVTSSNTLSVDVLNVAPTVTISGGAVVNEGSGYLLTLSLIDPGDDTVTSWQITWGDSTVETVVGSTTQVGHTYADGFNSVTISATAFDEDGAFASNSLAVSIQNVAPTLIISGPPEVDEGTAYTLGLSSSDPGQDTISQWEIAWGDGSVETFPGAATQATHVFADGPGMVTITATASDEDGSFPSNAISVTVNNVDPTFTISGPPEADEGSTYTLNLASSDPGADTITQVVVNWGDGNVETFAGIPGAVSHVFADGDNAYVVSATASDDDGAYASNAVNVTVNNVAPTLTISGAPEVDEGSIFTLGLASSDPGADTISQWVIDWNDGNVETFAGNPMFVFHSYADGPAAHTISATASDDDGSYVSNALSVTVNNVSPTITISGDATATIGQAYTLNLTATDPGDDTISQTVIDWGDGNVDTLAGLPSSVSHTYTAAAPAQISVAVTDEDGVTQSDPLSVLVGVGNEPPSDISFFTSGGDEGDSANLTVRFVDPDLADLHNVTVNWYDVNDTLIGSEMQSGSGNVDAAGVRTFNFAQLYAQDTAAYADVEVVEQNASAGTTTGTASFGVANVAPSELVISANVLSTLAEGGSITLEGSFLDPGTEDPHEVWVDWGDGDPPTTPELVLASGVLSFSLDHLYEDNGGYTIAVTIEDEDGAATTRTLDIEVLNVGPSAIVLSAAAGNSQTVLSGSFLDPGILDTHDVSIAWGDGGTTDLSLGEGELTFEALHNYGSGFSYTATVTVTDKDGAVGMGSATFYIGDVEYRVSSVGAFTPVTTDPQITSLSGSFSQSGSDWYADWVDAVNNSVTGFVDESGNSPYFGSYTASSYFPDPYGPFQVTTAGMIGGDFSSLDPDQKLIAYDAGYGGFISDYDFDDAYVPIEVETRQQIVQSDVVVLEGYSPGQTTDQITIDQAVTVGLSGSSSTSGQWRLSASSNIQVAGVTLDTWQSLPAPGSVQVTGLSTGAASITLEVQGDAGYGGGVTASDTANLTVYDYGLTIQQGSASVTDDWNTTTAPDPFYVWADENGIATFNVLGSFLDSEPEGNMVLWQITDTTGATPPNGVLVSAGGEVTIDTNVITLPVEYTVSAHWDLNHDGIPNDGMKRSITVRPAKIDLDVDSDNTNEGGTPDRTTAEDAIELSGEGKYIALRAKSPEDVDYDNYKYVPVVLDLIPYGAPDDGYLIFSGGNVEFYTSSDGMNFSPLSTGELHTPSEIGLTPGSPLTLYLEGVSEGTGEVSVEYYTSNGVSAIDKVTVTVLGPHATCGCGASVGPDGDYETSSAGVSGGQLSSDTYLSGDSANNELVNLPEIVLAGNAIVFRQNREVRIYDLLKSGGIVPRVEEQGQLAIVGGNYVESDPAGYKSTYSGA